MSCDHYCAYSLLNTLLPYSKLLGCFLVSFRKQEVDPMTSGGRNPQSSKPEVLGKEWDALPSDWLPPTQERARGGGHEGRVMLGRLEATATQQNVSESAQRFQCLTLGDSGHNSNGLSGCPFPTCLLLGSCENSLE